MTIGEARTLARERFGAATKVEVVRRDGIDVKELTIPEDGVRRFPIDTTWARIFREVTRQRAAYGAAREGAT